MHGPLHSLRRLVGTSSATAAAPPPELPEWLRDLPREVCLCTSTVPGLAYGICAAQRIQQGTWIGPFQGVLLPPEKVQAGAVRNTQHLWEVSLPPPSTSPPTEGSTSGESLLCFLESDSGEYFCGHEIPGFSSTCSKEARSLA